MSTPKKQPGQPGATRRPLDGAQPPRAAVRQPPAPSRHGGRPANGRHVESAVPGHGPYDYSGAVGSNVVPTPGRTADSDVPEVLAAEPWSAAYPTSGMENGPMF